MYRRLNRFLQRHKFLLAIARIVVFCIRLCRRGILYPFRSLVIKRYLRSHRIRKLQIGAGANALEGWLNTDYYPSYWRVVFLDARKPFPLRDCTLDYILSEHQIEHLTYNEGLFMLRECYRVLKPGGRIRIATPDLEVLIGLHTPEKSDLQQRYVKWIIDEFIPDVGTYRDSFVINYAFRNFGHQFIYDQATLQGAMGEAGFVDVTRFAVGESDDEDLRGVESHDKAAGVDDTMNRFETMVLEAKRPI